jgi:hypothetical protein
MSDFRIDEAGFTRFALIVRRRRGALDGGAGR